VSGGEVHHQLEGCEPEHLHQGHRARVTEVVGVDGHPVLNKQV